ncbi:hypothetical protein ACFZDG_01410 [Kitasatospora xanthocidica]|uniref:hypothetical protein n=1 Tax=Kitasatospora xanthocidica TaxID=83382 RepID=UPI0036ECC3CA
METTVNPAGVMHDIPPQVLAEVTRSAVKARLFGVDNYFREACWTFGEDVREVLPVALCVLKPESAVGRRYDTALRALLDNGFRPVDVLRFRHDRLTIRETWRFQLNFAAPERIATMDLVLPSLDSVLLVLADERWRPGGIPGSVRLAALKGPSAAELRKPEHLRQRLGAINGLFNFVHTTDEPIDVLRDLGLLCSAERRELVRERIRERHDALPETRRVLEEIEAATEPHDLDLEASWERLVKSGAPAGELARRRAAGEEVTVRELQDAARHPQADPRDHWDLLAVLTSTITFNVPDVERIFPNVLLSAWQPDTAGVAG